MSNKIILGISAYYHDSAAALVQGGDIVAAAQEERFTRKKHDPGFPSHAIGYCLEEAGIVLSDVDYIVFYDKLLYQFEKAEKQSEALKVVQSITLPERNS